MTKSTSRSALDRQRSLAKALRPGVAPLRGMVASGYVSLSLVRAFEELKLNLTDETDWKVFAVLLADHVFGEGKPRGRPAWNGVQLATLLAAVHQRKQNNPRLSDEQICKLLAKDKTSPPYFRVGQRGTPGTGQGLVKRLQDARDHFKTNALARAGSPLAFGRN
jgi:hypothetical protein